MKLTKKQKQVVSQVDNNKLYSIEDASKLLKEINYTKFDASVDVHIRLGLDPRKPDQSLRGAVTLPNGTGKTKKVLVLCNPDKENEAKTAGADYVGLDEYIEKMNGGWLDIDIIIATPDVMAKVGKLGRVLGPRGLMPNPRTGTVTPDVSTAVTEVKKGKISFRIDKFGIIHASVGRVSFTPQQIVENATELISTISRMKPSTAKGTYFKSLFMASTMSPGIQIDLKSVKGI